MQHDLDKGHLNEEQKSYFETHAVWLCARREDVGKRNGRKLAHLAEDEQRFLHQLYTEHEETKYMNKHASTHIDFSTEKHDEITNDQQASSPLEIHMCWNVLNDENGSTDPYRILALRWGDDFNLDRGGYEGFKLLGHALANCRKHSSPTGKHEICINVKS